MGEKEGRRGGEGKQRELERLLKLKEEREGGKEVLSRLLGEPPKQAAPPPVPRREAGPVLSSEVKGKVEKVLDRYGTAEILKLEGESLPLYRLRIPELTEKERELLATCKRKAVEEIKVDPESIADPSERRRVFMQELMKILERESKGTRLPSARLKELSELAFHDMIGYGPLDYLIADDRLEDILVIGVNKPVYVYHSRYGMCSTNIVFEEEDTIRYYIDKMARLVGRRIDHQMPLLDARLPDGSRINATIPPVSLEGPTLSIRKFRRDPLTVVDLMNFGTLSPEVGAFLWLLVHGLDVKPANILFAGGTGSGKTTLLNCATTFVPEHERIISIEDTAELQLPHPHWVRLETRPPNIEGRGEITMDDLVKNALRMRPDRIVVGEVRGPEARTMFTAMNTGHDGALLGTSVIQLADGSQGEIGEVCEELFRRYAGRERRYRGLQFIELDEGDRFEVVSVDGRLRAGARAVTRVWRRRVGEGMVRVLTGSGHELVLTKDHPLFAVAGEGVVKREAGSLQPGELVACLSRCPPSAGDCVGPSSALGLLASDVCWEEVEGVEEVEREGETVYDLTVEGNHNYVANGVLVSNCMGTLHANSAAETITRLTEAPMSVPPIMIPALDVVVMLQRIYHRQKGHLRRITEIAEVTGLEGGKPQLSRVFKWNPRTDKVEPTGVPLKFRQVLSELSGRSGTEIEVELKRRAAVLEWMRSKGIRNVFEVGRVIQEYYQDPEGVLKRVKGG